MSWEEYLITLYLRICKDYEENLSLSCQRFTNGGYKQFTAKIAPEVASRGYCPAKKLYYHGVKAHVVARKRAGTLPDLEVLIIEDVFRHNGPVFEQIRLMLHDNLGFGDQAYKRPDVQLIEIKQDLKIMTLIKK